MHPILAKAISCVCIAGTGAAVMPVAHAVQRHLKPRSAVHRTVRHAPAAAPVAARPSLDCPPAVAAAEGAPVSLASLGDAGMSPAAAAAGFPFEPAGSGTTAGFAGGGPGGGFAGGGPGGGGGGGGGSGGAQVPPGGGSFPVSPPVTPAAPSALPEPASWALMVVGFGTLGGALRVARRQGGSAAGGPA